MFLARLLFRPASAGRILGVPAWLRPSKQGSLNCNTKLSLSFLPRVHLSNSSDPSSEPSDSKVYLEDEFRRLLKLDVAAFAIGPHGLEVESSDGRAMRKTLPYIWLRDNCRCSTCVNQDTQQREVKTFEIPRDIHATDIKVQAEEVDGYPPGVRLAWSDQHTSYYSWTFLSQYIRYTNLRRGEPHPTTTWGSSGIKDNRARFSKVMRDDSSLAGLLQKIHDVGYAIVTETPYHDAEPTRQLLERIAFIRVTHYGGFYDFIPDLAMADTAYTNLALPVHTDTTYFTDPAGLQAFHLLSHQLPTETAATTHSGASEAESASQTTSLGGQSLLVDGFRAAGRLRQLNPWFYRILSEYKLPWHASGNKGIAIAPDKLYPVLEHDPSTGRLHRIRWNNDDRGVVPWQGEMKPQDWYRAAWVWNDILTDESMVLRYQLKPGEVLIFDNYRVLHGRTAFTGIRRICGGYINRDDYVSRFRTLNQDPARVRLRVIGC